MDFFDGAFETSPGCNVSVLGDIGVRHGFVAAFALAVLTETEHEDQTEEFTFECLTEKTSVPPEPALHSWELSTAEARELQRRLAASVDATRPLSSIQTLAGANVLTIDRIAGFMPRWSCSGRTPGR